MDAGQDEEGKTLIESSETAQAARRLSVPSEAVSHPDAPSLPGYRLCALIGRGAFAEVWKGWQERTHKWVAVKVFTRRAGFDWVLLQREVERLVRLDKHPYIVSLLDADLTGPTAYYALDLIEAGSLEHLVSLPRRGGVESTARMMEQVAQALAYVHSKGVIHCDLKPANILIDEEGRPRVADFGQSRVVSDSAAALGTLFYMAPEQTESASPDVRWDVYALGATFFTLLTGKAPHEAALTGSVEERLRGYRERIASEGRVRVGRPDVDEDLAAIVERCLEPRAEDRYANAAEVLRDLERRRAKEPVSPLAGDARYRARKFFQRNRVLAAVSAAAFLALLGAGARLLQERDNLRRQLAVSYLARSQLEFLKGNPLRAITYGAHSNGLQPSHVARTSTLRYLSETASPLFVYPGEGPALFSPDGALAAASDPAFGAEIRAVSSARLVAGPMRARGDILAMSFNADGSVLATGTRDKEVRLWDAAKGRPLSAPWALGSAVTALALSGDGRWLAAGGAGGELRLWDTASGRPVGELPRHEDRVTVLLFAKDGETMLSGSELEGVARLWRARDGKPLGELRLAERLHGAAFSEDGRLAVTAGGDKTVRLWDARDGRGVGRPMVHGAHVVAVAFSADGRRLISGGWDAQARLWDVATQSPIGKPMKQGGDIMAAAFSPDGRLIVTGSADTTARIWDAATQEPYGRLLEHPTAVRGVSFLPDGSGVLSQSVGGSARLWKLDPALPADRALAHGAGVWDASFSPDGTKVVTASKDGTAKVWDAATGAVLAVLPHEDRVPSARFSPDGRKIVTGSWKGQVRLWDASDGRLLAAAPHGKDILVTDYSRDGRLILTAGKDGLVRLWETRDLRPLPFSIQHPGELRAASLSPDGRWILTAGRDSVARLWDAATGKPAGKPMAHDDEVNCAVFSPDGSLALTGSSDLTARLWRVPSGEPVEKVLMRHKDAVRAAAFSRDGKRLLTSGLDQRMRLWDAATGRGIGPLMSHAGVIVSVAFSPDGKTLLSGGVEGISRLWDADTGIAIGAFTHKSAVLVAAFSPDGRRVLTASSDGTAHVWDAPWLTQEISPAGLKRLADRATIKEINAKGEMVTISLSRWEEAFLTAPRKEP